MSGLVSRLPTGIFGLAIASACAGAELSVAPVYTLDQALAVARERNPDLAEAQSRLAEAESRSRQAAAGALPNIFLRGAYDYWTEDQRLFPATRNNAPGVFGDQTLAAEAIARLPLYTGGRVSNEKQAARFNIASAAHASDRIKEQLAFHVTATFYALLAQEQVLRSLESGVQAMDEQQRAIEALVNAEKAAKVDALRATVRRSELYERLVRERNQRHVTQRAWAALLGLEDAAAPEADGQLALQEVPACPDAGVCMEKALRQRADYLAAQAAVSSAQASVRSARAGYRPTLTAQASYGARWMLSPTDQPAGTDDQEVLGRVGVVAEVPLFDGRLTSARVAEQTARLQGAIERQRKLELQIRFEVESALSETASALERVAVSEQSIHQAAESFRIVKEKYDLGKGTLTDLLDAQTALIVSETSHARALADLATADARRKLAVGELVP